MYFSLPKGSPLQHGAPPFPPAHGPIPRNINSTKTSARATRGQYLSRSYVYSAFRILYTIDPHECQCGGGTYANTAAPSALKTPKGNSSEHAGPGKCLHVAWQLRLLHQAVILTPQEVFRARLPPARTSKRTAEKPASGACTVMHGKNM